MRRGRRDLLLPDDRARRGVERVDVIVQRGGDDDVLTARNAFEVERLRERRALDRSVERRVLVNRGCLGLGECRVDVETVA